MCFFFGVQFWSLVDTPGASLPEWRFFLLMELCRIDFVSCMKYSHLKRTCFYAWRWMGSLFTSLMVMAILTLFYISFVLHWSWLYYTVLQCQYFILVIRT